MQSMIKKNARGISRSVINRLPRYYRFLNTLIDQGTMRISSAELSQLMNVTASQIRQDLNCFGGFGQQGYGYHVDNLKKEIESILGLNNAIRAILIGTGNLGNALAHGDNLLDRGFQLVAAFDVNPNVIGSKIANVEIHHIDNLGDVCARLNPKMAILCIPTSESLKIVDRLVQCGIEGVWNFTSYDFAGFKGLTSVNVHLEDSIMTLSYLMKNKGSEKIRAKKRTKVEMEALRDIDFDEFDEENS